nr:hypothetical protein [Tanacetum cinerariifolium]
VSLMLVLKKKTVLCRFKTKGWDILVRRLEKWGMFGKKSLGGYGFISPGSNTKHLESLKSRSKFEHLCIESRISRHLTVVGTPQQNRVAKRYLEGVKGYRLYRLDDESPKIVTSRNVVFNESVMYKDTLKDSGAGDKSVEELQVEAKLQSLNNHTPEEDHTNQEDGDDEDVGDQATDQLLDLTYYQLVWDKEPRTRMKRLRF